MKPFQGAGQSGALAQSRSRRVGPQKHRETAHDRVLGWLLPVCGAWIGAIYGYVYVSLISHRSVDRRLELIDAILRGEGKADWVYAMYTVARISRWLVEEVGHPRVVLGLIDLIGMVLVFTSAAYFLRAVFPRSRSWLAGLLWLAVTSPLLFRDHYYHPSDFYGVSLMFLILVSARRHEPGRMAVLCLLSGILWEKALFVPLFFFVGEARTFGTRRGLVRAVPAVAAVGAVFVFWRVAFPDPQRHLATWPEMFARLPSDLVLWSLWIGPLALALVTAARRGRPVDPFWTTWLFYLPLLVGVVFVLTRFWGELRTFWILQPVFVGVMADWADKALGNSRSAVP